MRPATADDLNDLCRGITRSFVHLETRDAYGTEVELPHFAKWQRGEPDDHGWFQWWLDLLRAHRTAGKTCRRARIVSEPVSDYQRWIFSSVEVCVEAGEDTRYVPRSRLTSVALPGSGDFYVFDDEVALFLHYAGTGLSASYEITDDPEIVQTCRQGFDTVWDLGTPARDYRPE